MELLNSKNLDIIIRNSLLEDYINNEKERLEQEVKTNLDPIKDAPSIINFRSKELYDKYLDCEKALALSAGLGKILLSKSMKLDSVILFTQAINCLEDKVYTPEEIFIGLKTDDTDPSVAKYDRVNSDIVNNFKMKFIDIVAKCKDSYYTNCFSSDTRKSIADFNKEYLEYNIPKIICVMKLLQDIEQDL